MQTIGEILGPGHRRPLVDVYESHGLSSLAAWRLASPMTRQVLSAVSGVPVDDIGQIERSERLPTARESTELARSLGAEPRELFPDSLLLRG